MRADQEYITLPLITVKTENNELMVADEPLETATIAAYLDTIRSKGGGFLFFRRPVEHIKFASYVYLPLMAMYYNDDRNQLILYDTADLFFKVFEYYTPPPTEALITELKKNKPLNVDVEEFIEALKLVEKRLEKSPNPVSYKIHYLSGEIIKDLIDDISLASYSMPKGYILRPRIAVEQIGNEHNTLINLKDMCRKDIYQLTDFLDYTQRIATEWIEYLSNKQLEIRESYNEKIESIRPEVIERVRDYEQKLNQELNIIETKAAHRISSLEAEIQRLKIQEDVYKDEEKTYEKINPVAARTARKMRENIEKKRKELEKQLNEIVESKNRQIKSIREKYNKLIEREWDRIRQLERERDKAISLLEDRKAEISKLIDKIQKKVDNLVKEKESIIKEIDNAGITLPAEVKEHLENRSSFYILIPLVVACMEGDKLRCTVIPPSILEKGFLGRLFGGSSLKLSIRTKTYEKIKDMLEKMMTSDQSLREEIFTFGQSHNILASQATKEHLAKGLKKLLEMGFINDKQYQEISSTYGI